MRSPLRTKEVTDANGNRTCKFGKTEDIIQKESVRGSTYKKFERVESEDGPTVVRSPKLKTKTKTQNMRSSLVKPAQLLERSLLIVLLQSLERVCLTA